MYYPKTHIAVWVNPINHTINYQEEIPVKKFHAVLMTLLMALVLAASAQAKTLEPVTYVPPDLENLVVYGDSLSDSGNIYALTGGATPVTTTYWQGRWSNGPVWSENMADLMGTANDYLAAPFTVAPPVAYSTTMFFNNACGGATTDAPFPNYTGQVDLWTASQASIPAKTLVAVWIGANDLLGLPCDILSMIDSSISNIKNGLDDIVALGATHIAVCNLPDLGATPRFLGTPDQQDATDATTAFNNELDNMLDTFKINNPGVTIYDINVFAMFEQAQESPAVFGVTNVVSAAVTIPGMTFETADDYLFWDTIHPTRKAHEQLAALIYGDIFIGAQGVSYVKTDGTSGGVVGVSCANGDVAGLSFENIHGTAEEDRPMQPLYGLMKFTVNLTTPGDTAQIVINLPEALPEGFTWFKYINGRWIDFVEVFASTGGLQGAQISADRKQVTIYIEDNGQYDLDGTSGVVVDPVAAGSPDPDNGSYVDHGDEDCFVQASRAGANGGLMVLVISGLLMLGMAVRLRRS